MDVLHSFDEIDALVRVTGEPTILLHGHTPGRYPSRAAVLARQPAYVAACVRRLALAIRANAAIFAVVNASSQPRDIVPRVVMQALPSVGVRGRRDGGGSVAARVRGTGLRDVGDRDATTCVSAAAVLVCTATFAAIDSAAGVLTLDPVEALRAD
jgi:hypothetical protein